MDMIDRFLMLVKLVNDKNKATIPSPILIWKIHHRKYEILKEIHKSKYTADDLRKISWVISYAYNKWEESIKLFPDGMRVDSYGKGFCVYRFELSDEYNFTVNVSPSSDILDIVQWSISMKHWTNETELNEIMTSVIYTACRDAFKHIMDRLIKGD